MTTMTARNPLKPVHTLVAFDPDGKEHTIARTSARYDYAGFIRVAARGGQPEGWYPVAKGFSYKSVHARTRSAHLHDALSYDYRTVHVWRKGSESYERNLAAAQAKAEDLARTARRQARLPDRLATVEAANQASGERPYTVVLAAALDRRVQSATVTLNATSPAEAAAYVGRWHLGVLTNLHIASVHEAQPHELAQRASLRYTPPQAETDSTDSDQQSADDYAAIERGEL